MSNGDKSELSWIRDSITFNRVATIVALILLAVLVYGVFNNGTKDMGDQFVNWFDRAGQMNSARGIITTLVVLVTVVIALVLVFGVLFVEPGTYKERFSLGKDVLTIFIGILGTIMGYYYAENRVSTDDISKITAASASQQETQTISDLEKKAFTALLAKDYDGASKAFADAYQAYPTWHNVDEINRLLKSQQDNFKKAGNDAEQRRQIWQAIFCDISNNHRTQGMTKEMIAEIQKSCTGDNNASGANTNSPQNGTH
jgi:hypothetical protein